MDKQNREYQGDKRDLRDLREVAINRNVRVITLVSLVPMVPIVTIVTINRNVRAIPLVSIVPLGPFGPLLALLGISPLYLPKIPSQIPLIYIHCYCILCNIGNIVGDKRSKQEQGLNPQRCTITHLTFIPANKQPYDTTLKRERMQTQKSASSIIYYTIVSPNWQWRPKD